MEDLCQNPRRNHGHNRQYKYQFGFLSSGNDFKPVFNATYSGCKAACDASAACRGFSFEANAPIPAPQETFRCYSKTVVHFVGSPAPSPNQIFTDSLYGQMLSHHFFDGNFTLDTSFLSSHLEYEWEKNQDKYGMRVLSDPVQEDSVWMNGPPTWTYLQLALGKLGTEESLEPFKRMSENFRIRLKDMWNLRALTHTDGSIKPAETSRLLEAGAPREQGHYGFMLTDLYLLPFLSGQSVNLAEGRLLLKPYFPPPYVLPVLLSGLEASVSAEKKGVYTFHVAFGALALPKGGLTVDGVAYPEVINMKAGDTISWP